MANTYDIGDVVHITAVFSQASVAMDPDTVEVKVKAPDATSTTYAYPAQVTKDGVGNYHVDIAPALSGTYRYRWVSTGAGAGAEESWFQVRIRRVP